ncbi:ribosomal protein S10 component of cytosolic 80S ribosome and 40S small subunit [Haematococcus lacustris]
MLISKKSRREVYKYLFKEGVLQAEKDYNKAKHSDELDIPNLQVIKMMQSFTSLELVTERFAWRHYYWFLTDKGIEYLREYLGLPQDVVPATLKKSQKPLERMPARAGGDRPGGPRRFGDREGGGGFGGRDGGYRSGPREGGFGRGAGGEDKAGAPGAYQPRFGGGFGCGAPPS